MVCYRNLIEHMFFSFHIKYKFYYFVTEASHGNHGYSNVDPQIDSPSSMDVEDSDDDDVQIGKFLFVPDKLC